MELPSRSPAIRPTSLDLLGLAALFVMAVTPAIPVVGRLLIGTLFILTGVVAIHRLHRDSGAVLALVGVAEVVFGCPAPLGQWPFFYLIPLVALVLLAIFTGHPISETTNIRVGRIGRTETVLIVSFVALSATALVIWAMAVKPDLSRAHSLVPRVPIPLLIPLGLCFALFNASIEEIIWRGIFLRWLRGFTSAPLAVAIQAFSFGAAHWTGIPSGPSGVGLAAIYGLMMGVLAMIADGLLAPIFAHVFADVVIFSLILALA